MKTVLMLVFLVSLLGSVSAWAEEMYVMAAQTSITMEPKAGSAKVMDVKRGDALSVLEKKESWLKVKINSKEGWISKLFVSNMKPIGQATLNKDVTVNLEKSSRRRTSSFAATASTRGLNADERVREGRELYQQDYDSLKKVDAYQVKPEKLEKFKNEGNLK